LKHKGKDRTHQPAPVKKQPRRPWLARAIINAAIVILTPPAVGHIWDALRPHLLWLWLAVGVLAALVIVREFLAAGTPGESSEGALEAVRPYAVWVWGALILLGMLAILQQLSAIQLSQARPAVLSTGGAGIYNAGAGKVTVHGKVLGGNAAGSESSENR
jgi:hypothetical protein